MISNPRKLLNERSIILLHSSYVLFCLCLQDLENQMDVAEKRRLTLLKDFLEI